MKLSPKTKDQSKSSSFSLPAAGDVRTPAKRRSGVAARRIVRGCRVVVGIPSSSTSRKRASRSDNRSGYEGGAEQQLPPQPALQQTASKPCTDNVLPHSAASSSKRAKSEDGRRGSTAIEQPLQQHSGVCLSIRQLESASEVARLTQAIRRAFDEGEINVYTVMEWLNGCQIDLETAIFCIMAMNPPSFLTGSSNCFVGRALF